MFVADPAGGGAYVPLRCEIEFDIERRAAAAPNGR
jgi:hypothetical protein